MYMDTKHLDPKHRWVTLLFPAIADNPNCHSLSLPHWLWRGFQQWCQQRLPCGLIGCWMNNYLFIVEIAFYTMRTYL